MWLADGMASTSSSSSATCPASRKQSASDLQSRLKTRKLLGVGELRPPDAVGGGGGGGAANYGDADSTCQQQQRVGSGAVYRSKIAQLLGVDQHFGCCNGCGGASSSPQQHHRFWPRGLSVWHWANEIFFLASGLTCFAAPHLGVRLELAALACDAAGQEVTSSSSALSPPVDVIVRLYGASLISFGVLYRSTLNANPCSSATLSSVLLASAAFHALQLVVIVTASPSSSAPTNWWLTLRASALLGNLLFRSLLDDGTLGGLVKRFYAWRRARLEDSLFTSSRTTSLSQESSVVGGSSAASKKTE